MKQQKTAAIKRHKTEAAQKNRFYGTGFLNSRLVLQKIKNIKEE